MKNVLQPCRLSCGSENPGGEFSDIAGPLAGPQPSEKSTSCLQRRVRWDEVPLLHFQLIPDHCYHLPQAPVEVTLPSVIHTVKHTTRKHWFSLYILPSPPGWNQPGTTVHLYLFFSNCILIFLTGHLSFSPDYLNSQRLSYYLVLPIPVPFHLWNWMHPSKQFSWMK